MADILPNNETRASLTKVVSGRKLFKVVSVNDVAAQQALGWEKVQIRMKRVPLQPGKYKFYVIPL